MLTDPNGLLYMRTRFYNPNLKRFMNADVLDGSIEDSTTLNLYTYVNGNPISFVDPFGMVKERGQNGGVLENLWDGILDYYGNMFDGAVDVFKFLTREGLLDLQMLLWLGALKDDDGIYHISDNYWQSIHFVGYNDLYDNAFEFGTGLTGTSMDKREFPFTTEDGTEYIIWLWKGDYINFGAGAEAGIYKESIIPGHWLTDKADAMKMELSLSYADGTPIFNYAPNEKRWWITGFDPHNQTVQANDLIATVTIDFTGKDALFEGFYNAWKEDEWIFDYNRKTAKITW